VREVSEDMGNTEDLIPPPGPASARQFHRFGKAGGAALCLALGAAACRAGPPVDVAGAQADARWMLGVLRPRPDWAIGPNCRGRLGWLERRSVRRGGTRFSMRTERRDSADVSRRSGSRSASRSTGRSPVCRVRAMTHPGILLERDVGVSLLQLVGSRPFDVREI
jgi:hypothetical protein